MNKHIEMNQETMDRIDEYVENQELVRQRLIAIYKTLSFSPEYMQEYGRVIRRPSLLRLSAEIGVASASLNLFINGTRRVELRVLWTIDAWLRKKEAELKDKITLDKKS